MHICIEHQKQFVLMVEHEDVVDVDDDAEVQNVELIEVHEQLEQMVGKLYIWLVMIHIFRISHCDKMKIMKQF